MRGQAFIRVVLQFRPSQAEVRSGCFDKALGCNSARASSSTRLGSGAVRESNSMSRDNSVQTPTAFRDYFLNCRSWGKIMGQIVCLCSSSQLQQSYRRRYSDCSQSVPSFTCSNSMRIAEKNAWGFYKYILNSCLCVFSLLHLQAMLGCVFQLHLQKKKNNTACFLTQKWFSLNSHF